MKRCPHGRWQQWDASLKESKHHIQMRLTEEFEVGRRQMTVEIWLNPSSESLYATHKPSTHLSFHFPVHSTSPQGFRILISFCTVPRKFTWWDQKCMKSYPVTQNCSPFTFPMGIKEYERTSILVLWRTMYIHKHVPIWSKIFWKSSMYPRLSREGL